MSAPIPVDALVRYAETEAAAATLRAESSRMLSFRLINEHLAANWQVFAKNLTLYGIEEMQRMADEDLTDAKDL